MEKINCIESIKEFGDLKVSFETLNNEHFKVSEVWVEFYEQNELTDIKQTGVDDSWLERYFFKPMDDLNTHAYYTIIGSENFRAKEYLFVACEGLIDGLNVTGYMHVVDGDISCFTAFGNKDFDFYLSDTFADENSQSLTQLAEYLGVVSLGNKFQFRLRRDMSGILQRDFSLEFPVE